MRLEKLLAYSGIASRRKSKELILAGYVKVNDEVCLEPGFRVQKVIMSLIWVKPLKWSKMFII